MLRLFKDKPLDWREIGLSLAFTMKDIIDNRDLPWDVESLINNANFEINVMDKFKNVNWDFAAITRNQYSHQHVYYYSAKIPQEFDENNMCSAEENLNKFKEELMQVTWNPQRKNMMKWCFSIDDQIE